MADERRPGRGARWPHLRRHRRLEAEIREEVEQHVAMRVEYLMSRGIPREVAERDARTRFGDFDATVRRLTRSAREREQKMRRREIIDDLRQDVRLTLRMFGRAPLFFAAAIFTLALGIGANGAVFSILQATLLQPLPYRAASDVVMIWRAWANPPDDPLAAKMPWFQRFGLNSDNLLGWRRDSRAVLTDVAGIYSWQGNLASQFDLPLRGRAERLRGAYVTPNFFEVLGVRPLLGRGFGTADEGSGEPLLVLSHDLWRTAFGADASVVGRPLTLVVGARPRQARTFTVIGILPAGFRFTYPEDTQAWAMMPWSTVEQFDPLAIAFHGVGRMAPGVTLAQVNARLAQFRTGLERANDTPETRQVLRAEPVRDWVIGNTRPTLYLLGGVTALLLLITCVTVANGLLARVSERRQELARRASLGAERGRLVRQLLTEGAVLSVCGVVAGSALALALQPVLRAVLPSSLPRIGEIAANGWTVIFAAGAVVISTVLAALAPALVGARPASIAGLLRISSGASADRATVRWRQGLMATQAAIATALLISASLLLTSFWRLGDVPLGFDGERVLTVEMRLLDERYRAVAARAEFQDRLIERVRAVPGVLDAGLTSVVPFRGVDFTLVPTLLGQTEEYSANGRFVDPGYFRVLRIPLMRGRLFDSTDRAGAPHVMVVSETFARKAFADSDPIGKMMDYRGPVEVVGVVGDVRYEELDREARPAIYLPRAQHPEGLICLVVRSAGRATSLGAAIQRAIHQIDPILPAMKLTTIDRIIDDSVADRRFYTASTAVFSAIALMLTIVGMAVVVARVIAERRRELAIRSALGANTRHLISRATRDGLAAVSTGVAVGLIAAFWGSTLLARFLFQVGGRSPLAYGMVTILVVTIAGVTAWLSSRRLGQLELASMLRAD